MIAQNYITGIHNVKIFRGMLNFFTNSTDMYSQVFQMYTIFFWGGIIYNKISGQKQTELSETFSKMLQIRVLSQTTKLPLNFHTQ